MKNLNALYLIICCVACGCFWSCSDETINSDRTGVYPASIVCNDSVEIHKFVINIYSHLPDGFNRMAGNSMVASAIDEAVHAVPGSGAQAWGEGSWNPSTTRDDNFGTNYQGIRRSFVFEEELYPNIPDRIISEKGKKQLLAQVFFVRAYCNYELLKRYGGYPLVKHALKIDEDLNIPRSTYDECVEYIVALCDSASKVLPLSYIDGQFGRITKGAALALKARVLLYAASPLFNDPAKPSDHLEHGAYDPAKWEKAAQAAAEVIKLKNEKNINVYALFNQYDAFFYTLVDNKVVNKEIILSRLREEGNTLEKQHGPSGYTGGEGGACPTWDLVSAYEMKDGTPFDWNNPVHAANPFANRDPRFEKSILYNGAKWMTGRTIETFEGGKDKLGDNATPTSFYLRKFFNINAYWNKPSGVSVHHWPLIRYGEVLLNYAEAMNEAFGPDADPKAYGMTAREAIKLIRTRAGLTGNTDLSVTVPVNDKDKMSEAIRQERRIELAFEEHRHLDVRRWKIAETVLNRPVWGLKIEKDKDGNYTYTPQEVQTRYFDKSKMYLYPFPQTEIGRNKNLKQNSNWEIQQ